MDTAKTANISDTAKGISDTRQSRLNIARL
jgi:hypothetical protein